MRLYLLFFSCFSFLFIQVSQAQIYPLATIYGAKLADEQAASVAVDHKGNIYSIGNMNASSMVFDTLTVLNPSTNRAMILLKQDANGKAKWAKVIAGDQGANRITKGQAMVMDKEDNLYIAGTWNLGSIHFDSLSVEGQSGIFLAKINPDGHALWVNKIEAISDNIRLEIGPDGIVHLLGSMTNDVTIGDTLLYAYTTNTHFFIASYTQDGVFKWGKSFGSGIQTQSGRDFALDPQGNFWVSGTYDYALTIDNLSLQNSGTYNAYVAKIDPKGQTLWVKNLPYQTQAEIRLASDPFGNVYWASTPSRGGYFLKFNPQGNIVWKDSTYSGADFDGNIGDVTTDPQGGVYFTGSDYGDIEIDNVEHDYGSFFDVFLVKYNANGSMDFIRYYQGPDWDIPYGICVAGPTNDVYICGESTDDRLDGNYMILRYDGDGKIVTAVENGLLKEDPLIRFAPHPIQNQSTVFMSKEESGTLEIVNAMGQVVKIAEGIQSGYVLEKEQLPLGIYSYRFYTKNQTQSGKISIQ